MNTFSRFKCPCWGPGHSQCRAYTGLDFFKQIFQARTLLLLWLVVIVFAESGCNSKNSPGKISAGAQPAKRVVDFPLYQLPDPNSRFSLSEVQRLPLSSWQSVPAINSGYRSGTVWAQSSVYSPRNQTVWLELQSHFMDSIQVWLVSGAGNPRTYPVTGFWQLSHAAANPLQHRYFLFELPLEAKQTYQVFIRAYGVPGVTLKYALKYWETTELLNYLRRVHWGWAIFVGTMLMAISLALINFVLHPRPIYLYYIGYVACMSLYALLNDGWGIFFPSFIYSWLNPVSLGIFIIGGVYFLLQFSRQFLSIPNTASEWWLRLHPAWFALLPSMFVGISQYGYAHQDMRLVRLGYQVDILTGLIAAFWWLSYLWAALQKGFRPTWLLLLSQLVMLGFYSINIIMVNTGMIQQAFPDMLVFRMALVIDLLIITFGLTYRQKVIRDSQQQLQAANVLQQRAILEAQSQRQAEEIKALRLQNELQSQRERLARDLHDGIGSQLTHIISRLDLLAFPCTTQQPQLLRLSEFTRDTNQNLRETIWILHQDTIAFQEFAARLHSFLLKLWEDRDTPVLLWHPPVSDDNPSLSPVMVMHILRMTQEATVNALKYAQASQVGVHLEARQDYVELMVIDNGRGFDPITLSTGYGLTNLRKRAEELSGCFCLSTTASGTHIRITLPINN
jgi:signal transduction histidine kinase